MGKTSWRGELEDREAEEEDSRSWARGKMGQIFAQSFIIIPGTPLFYFEVFPLLVIVRHFFTILFAQTSA